jgi:hypothetical protein
LIEVALLDEDRKVHYRLLHESVRTAYASSPSTGVRAKHGGKGIRVS